MIRREDLQAAQALQRDAELIAKEFGPACDLAHAFQIILDQQARLAKLLVKIMEETIP